MHTRLILILWLLGMLFPLGWLAGYSATYGRWFDVVFGPEWVHIIMHIALFAGMVFLILLVIRKPVDWRVALTVIAAALIVGIFQEGLQVMSRTTWGTKILVLSLFDLGIDILGALLGLGGAVFFQVHQHALYKQVEG